MLIGIGGASRSGKTMLAQKIQSHLGSEKCNIISLDEYTKPIKEIPSYKNQVDWEDPGGLDFNQLEMDIELSVANHHHTIAEGFLIFYKSQIKEKFDLSVYLSISEETFSNRKAEDLRWGEVSIDYINHIWQSHLINGVQKENTVDLYLKSDNNTIQDLFLKIRPHL